MKTNGKAILMILALMLALCIGIAALAEGPTDGTTGTTPASETPAVEAPASDAADSEAQAKADALKEALEAYSTAKAESRKQAWLDSLKQELDAFVASGKLTQEQADLIYEYYVEQMTLQQNGRGFGRGGNQGRGGQEGFGKQVSGKGGKRGGFGNTQTPQQTPESPIGGETAGT